MRPYLVCLLLVDSNNVTRRKKKPRRTKRKKIPDHRFPTPPSHSAMTIPSDLGGAEEEEEEENDVSIASNNTETEAPWAASG
jgi:hypothetical protein